MRLCGHSCLLCSVGIKRHMVVREAASCTHGVPLACLVAREGLMVRVPLHNDVRCPQRCFPAFLSRRVRNLGQRAEVRPVVGHYGLGKNVVPEVSSQGERQNNLPNCVREWVVFAGRAGGCVTSGVNTYSSGLAGRMPPSKTGTAATGVAVYRHPW